LDFIEGEERTLYVWSSVCRFGMSLWLKSSVIMNNSILTIRPELPRDIFAIRQVHSEAFGRPHEAALVEALRCADTLTISLVAVQDGRLCGHIAFSPVAITSDTATIGAVGLGPMGVLPEYQNLGIGSQLIVAGLRACRHTPYGIVVVLGHPTYYPRFGFVPSKPYGIVWERDVPEDVFMVKELQTGALAQTQGVVAYRPEFDHV
jgi:putative acetyltransferase